MSIPPVLAVPTGRAVGQLKRIGSGGLLALLAAAVIMLVSVLGALLPDPTLPLTWYVPVLDSAMGVTLALLLFLSSSHLVIPRHRHLPRFLPPAAHHQWSLHRTQHLASGRAISRPRFCRRLVPASSRPRTPHRDECDRRIDLREYRDHGLHVHAGSIRRLLVRRAWLDAPTLRRPAG